MRVKDLILTSHPAGIGQELIERERTSITCSIESSYAEKEILKKLYKSSERITQTKLFGQINELLNRFITGTNEDMKASIN